MDTKFRPLRRFHELPIGTRIAFAVPTISAAAQIGLLLADKEPPVWLGPLESLGLTLLALLAGLWLLVRSVRDTRARADRFHVGEALAVGYGLNFLLPTAQRLEPGHPAEPSLQLLAEASGLTLPAAIRMQRLLVALPRNVEGLNNQSITHLREQLAAQLGTNWWIGSARLSLASATDVVIPRSETQADKASASASLEASHSTGRGIGVTAVVHRTSGATVLIDLPSTLAVVPHFATFVAKRELEGSPWTNDLVEVARSSIVRRHEADKFARVLENGLDGRSVTPTADPPSAEDLLRRRLGPLRDRIDLVSMESPTDLSPLIDALRSAAQTLAPDARR